jgi:Sec-independent protein translocase protein TatA
MSIGIGQILEIVVVCVLLFGKFTGDSKDLAECFNVFRSTLDSKDTDSTVPSEKESSSSEESDAKKGS